MDMKKFRAHFKIRFLELVRHPSYVVTSLVFPSMFFWFFGVPNATDPYRAQILMASFSCFAFLGVVLFQFSVSLAQERTSPWNGFVRIMPVSTWTVFLSQLLMTVLFAALAVGAVILVAHITVPVELPNDRWVPLIGNLFLGGLPFAALGLLLGMVCSPKTAVPVANLVYLPLSFAGGLWLPPNALPAPVQKISDYLPTRMYAELVWSGVKGEAVKNWNSFGLLIFLAVFIFLSVFFYYRDTDQRYH
jgi:ABC-2 type transport system permease protein